MSTADRQRKGRPGGMESAYSYSGNSCLRTQHDTPHLDPNFPSFDAVQRCARVDGRMFYAQGELGTPEPKDQLFPFDVSSSFRSGTSTTPSGDNVEDEDEQPLTTSYTSIPMITTRENHRPNSSASTSEDSTMHTPTLSIVSTVSTGSSVDDSNSAITLRPPFLALSSPSPPPRVYPDLLSSSSDPAPSLKDDDITRTGVPRLATTDTSSYPHGDSTMSSAFGINDINPSLTRASIPTLTPASQVSQAAALVSPTPVRASISIPVYMPIAYHVF